MGVEDHWRLLPPILRRDEHPDTGGQPRWVERYPHCQDLAVRLVLLAWGAQRTAQDSSRPVEGQASRLRPVEGQASEDLDHDERVEILRRLRDGKASIKQRAQLRGDDLRKVDHLRVLPPGSSEPVCWWQNTTLNEAVRLITPPSPQSSHRLAGLSERRQEPESADAILVQDELLRRLVVALLTRPLVLLAGVSGSGKTQIARHVGRAYAAGAFAFAFEAKHQRTAKDVERVIDWLKGKGWLTSVEGEKGWWFLASEASNVPDGRFAFIAVQADWTDASHLWGYHIPLPKEAEGFYGTEVLKVFLDADRAWREDQPVRHFVLLDEMNLSRPEHYASDLLSAMEAQHKRSTREASDVIHLHRAGAQVRLRNSGEQNTRVWALDDGKEPWPDAPGQADGKAFRIPAPLEGDGVPPRIGWAPGLAVVGTVNIDETTFSFAPKVLDRAALIEFVNIDLRVVMTHGYGGRYKTTYQTYQKMFEEGLQRQLVPYNLHLGYRAAKEMLDVLALDEKAWDSLICDKVLPRIRGPRGSVEPLLVKLLHLEGVLGKDEKKDPTDEDLRTLLESTKDSKSTYPNTRRKLLSMLHRARTVGFTSYFG